MFSFLIKVAQITAIPAVLKFLKILKLQICPEIVLKFEIVLKSQSHSTNVLILTIVVRA